MSSRDSATRQVKRRTKLSSTGLAQCHFRCEDCPPESAVLLDHIRADEELGASVFWIRPDMLLGEPVEQFLTFWQTKRDGRCRGLVEIQP